MQRKILILFICLMFFCLAPVWADESKIVNGNFDIGVRAYTKSEAGILIDLVELSKEDGRPASMEIIGGRNVFVPPYGEERYKYTAGAMD